jgi:hypothetical protein
VGAWCVLSSILVENVRDVLHREVLKREIAPPMIARTHRCAAG